jgi:hypothetical protein
MNEPANADRFTTGALLATVLGAWFAAFLAIFDDRNWIGGGLCLLAAAVALSAPHRRT